VRGFNVIATANNRDKGINELSSALKRRFNTVILPVPANEEEEIAIVTKRVGEMGRALQLPGEPPALKEVRRVVQIFRNCYGQTEDGKTSQAVQRHWHRGPAINSGMALAGHLAMRAGDIAASLVGAIVKDPVQDAVVWREYQETVIKERSDWKDLYRACRDQD
jgi:hypothetical protein